MDDLAILHIFGDSRMQPKVRLYEVEPK